MSEGSGQPQRYCGSCGAQVRAGSTFCVSCGMQLTSDSEDLGPGSTNSVLNNARGLLQDSFEQSKKAYEEANTRYQRWNEQKATERERAEALRRIGWERDQRINRFERYRRFFEKAHEGSRSSLDWWRAYDTGEFDNEQPLVSELLLSARTRAEGGLRRLREMEGSLSDVLEREEFEKADLLLNGVEAGQENVEGEESIFSPLVAVHERIKGSESWANYRQNLERFVKDLEDFLDSPNVRTAPANRVRFPNPNRTQPSGIGTMRSSYPYTSGQAGSGPCQRCGAENSPQAAFCQNCGGSLQQAGTFTNTPVGSRSNGTVVAGYVFAFLTFLILPFILVWVAIALGIVNITRGDTGHGTAQILISIVAAFLGLLLYGAFVL